MSNIDDDIGVSAFKKRSRRHNTADNSIVISQLLEPVSLNKTNSNKNNEKEKSNIEYKKDKEIIYNKGNIEKDEQYIKEKNIKTRLGSQVHTLKGRYNSNNNKKKKEKYNYQDKLNIQDDYDMYDTEETPVQDILKEEFNETQKKLTARQKQAHKDVESWEQSRLYNSGYNRIDNTAINKEYAIDIEEEKRIDILVHDFKPEFLREYLHNNISLSQNTIMSVVRDPTSDIAILSRNGSQSLRYYRDIKLKMSGTKFWDINSSKMGQIIGLERVKSLDELADDAASIELNNNIINDNNNDSNEHIQKYKYSDTQLKDDIKSNIKSDTLEIQRKNLPVFSVRTEQLRIIRDNQIVILCGETGSGKTTQLPQYLLEDGYCNNGGIIGITQPRRLAAVSVAKRVSEELGINIGKQVGYSIRFDDCTSDETVLKYMTDGMLLRETLISPLLQSYSIIIMDEAHERSLNTDVLFGLMRNICSIRKDIKLIVTSATLDTNKFSYFFGNAPIFNIPGKTYPVEIIHRQTPSDDYIKDMVDLVLSIHISQSSGDILCFVTGQEDIEATCYFIHERIKELDQKILPLLILPIYSQLSAEHHTKIFEKTPKGIRKCVVATNIAETSLTIDGIRYVIDSGFCKLRVFSSKIGMDALQITPISQASAGQRKGRAGRTSPGICYRLYTEYQYFYELLQNTVPEIQRTNLNNVVLLLKSLGVTTIWEFDFMDPPPMNNIINSLYNLWVLGALLDDGSLSDMGKKMVEFPLDPPLSKMLITSTKLHCSNEIITITSMLCEPEIFLRPKDNIEEADLAKEKFHIPESDHLTMLNVYIQWLQNSSSSEWCRKHFLHFRKLQKVREIRSQIVEIMKKNHHTIISCKYDYDIIRKVICSSYFINAAKCKTIGQYVNLRTGITAFIHPSSCLFELGSIPDYIVYHELVMTTKQYARCITIVEGEWLAELGPMFFSIRETVRQMQLRRIAGSSTAPQVTSNSETQN